VTRSVVTGAAGFIGSHLVDRLLARGDAVLGIDSFSDYYGRALKEANLSSAREHTRFQLIEGDLLALDLAPLLEGADVIFHLAAQPGVRGSWGAGFVQYLRNNVEATQRLLEAARAAGVRRFVYTSSSSVYGDPERLPAVEETPARPVSPYGVTKLAGEHLCALYATAYGLPAVSLRLFTVYGPRQRPDMALHRFLRAAHTGERITVFGDGSQTRDFTYVGDVIEALVRASEAALSETAFNVCGGSAVSVKSLLPLVERTTGRRLEIDHAPGAPGDALHTLGDLTRAQRAFGYQPRVSLAEGLAAQWDWLRDPAAART
jgi:UDP-glucuronate 4-epimerase